MAKSSTKQATKTPNQRHRQKKGQAMQHERKQLKIKDKTIQRKTNPRCEGFTNEQETVESSGIFECTSALIQELKHP